MGSAKNDGAWDWRRLKDEDPAAKSTAWAHLIQTPWMARMIPPQHRTEVLVAGVAGWSRDGVSWSAVKLARTFHETLGISFQSPDPQRYVDALLYGLTLAWGVEVTAFSLSAEEAAVGFAVCDLIAKPPGKSMNRRGGVGIKGERHSPGKSAKPETNSGMALDEEAGARADDREGGGGPAAAEEGEEEELTYKEPSFKNARWMRKRPGAPRWTVKLCRLVERLMEAEESETETEVSTIIDDVWQLLLDCDKSGKDAVKAKIKEIKKKNKKKAKKQRRKEKKKEMKERRSSRRGKGRRMSSDSESSSTDSSSDSASDTSSTASSSSSGHHSKRKGRGGTQGSTSQPEFKWIDGKRHFRSKKTGDWVNCENPPKTACPECGGHHWWFDREKHGCKGRRK